MSPQLPDGRIIRVVNGNPQGYICGAIKDPLTGKVFLSGSKVETPFDPRDFIIDSTNKRIRSIDIPESLMAGVPKFYGSWQPKDENGDLIAETPLGITTDATYLYISFSDGKIRKYTTSGIIQTIASGVYYRDFGKVFNTLGKGISGVSGNVSYAIDLIGNTATARNFNLWNSRNEPYTQTILADTSTNKILLSSNKITIYDSASLIQQWQDWDNLDNISTVDYISSGLVVGKSGAGLVKKLSLSYVSRTIFGGGQYGYIADYFGKTIYVGSWMNTGYRFDPHWKERNREYHLYPKLTEGEKLNAEDAFIWWNQNSIMNGGNWIYSKVRVYQQDWLPLDVSDWDGGILIAEIGSEDGLYWYSPCILQVGTIGLRNETDMQFRLALSREEDSNWFGNPDNQYGFYGGWEPNRVLYVRQKASTVNSFQLDTGITWKDFTLR